MVLLLLIPTQDTSHTTHVVSMKPSTHTVHHSTYSYQQPHLQVWTVDLQYIQYDGQIQTQASIRIGYC